MSEFFSLCAVTLAVQAGVTPEGLASPCVTALLRGWGPLFRAEVPVTPSATVYKKSPGEIDVRGILLSERTPKGASRPASCSV